MKKFRWLMIIAVLYMLSIPSNALNTVITNTQIDITVNDSYIITDAEPFLVGGTTYVPIRFVSEALCADEVIWDAENETAIVRDNNTEIVMPIGKDLAYVNGIPISISGGIKLVNDRTFVPVRFISENLGATVNWDGVHLIVDIIKSNIQVPFELTYEREYNNNDIYWLSRIIEAEASGEPFIGKVGVADVVLNRVKSNDYPDTVYEVIFDRNFGVQFEPVINGTIYNTPAYESIVAAKYSLVGGNAVGDSMYFLNPRIATNFWIVNNRQYYTTVGNHSFYL